MVRSLNRIQKELADIENYPSSNFSAWVVDNNVDHWNAAIVGPDDSPYEGGLFYLDILLPEDYPLAPPKMVFTTKVYHPNIDSIGRFYIEALKRDWAPTRTISSILLSICFFLINPRLDRGYLIPKIWEVYKSDRAKFNSTAKEWTRKYAQ